MYLFLTNNINESQGRLDHAQVNRLRLFQKNNQMAKILTSTYNRFLHQNMKLNQLNDTDVINIYDWLQEAVVFNGQPKLMSSIEKVNQTKQVQQANGEIVVTKDGVKIIRVIPFSFNQKLVNEIHYFDFDGNITQKDLYDVRGFLSLRQYMDEKGHGVVTEQMMKVNGEVALELIYRKINQQYQITSYLIPSYQGHLQRFNDHTQLIQFVLNQIAQQCKKLKQSIIFFSDQNSIFDRPLAQMNDYGEKYLHWFDYHATKSDNTGSYLKTNYQFDFDHARKLDGIVVTTKKQAEDLIKNYEFKTKIYHIPVDYISEADLKESLVLMNKRTSAKLITVNAIEKESHLDRWLQVIAEVKQVFPTVTFELGGVVTDQQEQKRLINLVKELEIENNVKFKTNEDNEALYRDAQLVLTSSIKERDAVMLIDALKYGVPVVSTVENYSVNEMVIRQGNGLITKGDDIHQLAKQIIELLQNEDRLQEMSSKAYDLGNREYIENKVWDIWEKTIVGKESK